MSFKTFHVDVFALERLRKDGAISRKELVNAAKITIKGYERIIAYARTSEDTIRLIANKLGVSIASLQAKTNTAPGRNDKSDSPQNVSQSHKRSFDLFSSTLDDNFRLADPIGLLDDAEGRLRKSVAECMIETLAFELQNRSVNITASRLSESIIRIRIGSYDCFASHSWDRLGKLSVCVSGIPFPDSHYTESWEQRQKIHSVGRIRQVVCSCENFDFIRSPVKKEVLHHCFQRMLDAGKKAVEGGYDAIRSKVLRLKLTGNQYLDEFQGLLRASTTGELAPDDLVLFAWDKKTGGYGVATEQSLKNAESMFQKNSQMENTGLSTLDLLSAYFGTFLESKELFDLYDHPTTVNLNHAKYSDKPIQLAEKILWGDGWCAGQIIGREGDAVFEAWFPSTYAKAHNGNMNCFQTHHARDLARKCTSQVLEVCRSGFHLMQSKTTSMGL